MSIDNGVGVPPQPLEIAISFNVAGAFGPMHQTSKKYLKQLIKSLDESLLQNILSITSPHHKPKLALFAHGFHKNDADGIRMTQFTDDVNQLCQFVSMTSPMAWGSREHCYELVLRKARSLSWTPGSKRALILVGCTRPHEGCHLGAEERLHWRVEARCLAQKGIAIFAVEVKLQNEASDFYRELAEITEGCHVTLEQFTPMGDVIRAIVSHLAGPEKLEEFEHEILDLVDEDAYTSDMAQLFLTLRHHGNDMTSLPPGTPTGGTPQGSDFNSDSDYDNNVNEKQWRPPEPEESRMTSPVPACPHESHMPVVQLKRSKTAPGRVVWGGRGKASGIEGEAGSKARSSQRRNGSVGESFQGGARMKLRRGVTSAGTLAGDGGVLDEAEEDSLPRKNPSSAGANAAADVYKIDRTAPAKRENVSPRTFTLRNLSWSPWKLVISPTLPPSGDSSEECWEPRCDVTTRSQHGYRRKTLTQNSPDTLGASLFEVALKAKGSSRKRVVYHACLAELRDDPSWETQLLGHKDIQQEVSEALGKKCGVFVRWASLSQNGGRAHAIVEAALHKYDYAWNVSHSLYRRCVRRVEFY